MAEIKGRKINLTNARSVFVGHKDECDSYYIQFKNGTTIQRFRISEEAACALFDLLDGCIGTGREGKGTAEPHVEHTPIGGGYWRWQPIKELDA